jgi:hypothetical protein
MPLISTCNLVAPHMQNEFLPKMVAHFTPFFTEYLSFFGGPDVQSPAASLEETALGL